MMTDNNRIATAASVDADVRPDMLRRLRIRTALWPGKRASEGALLVKLHDGAMAGSIFWCVQTQEDVESVRDMANSFARSVYAMSSPSMLDSRGKTITDCSENLIVSLAKRYVEDIRLIQPNGSYCLAGYCAGCEIIYEIARQLTAAGGEVELLLLVEPIQAIEVSNRLHLFLLKYMMSSHAGTVQLNSFFVLLKKLFTLPLREWISYSKLLIRQTIDHNWFEKVDLSTVSKDSANDHDNAFISRSNVGVHCVVRRPEGTRLFRGGWDDYTTTFGPSYNFPPYAGHISLIFGTSSATAFQRVRMLRPYTESFWKSRALAGVDVSLVPGHHGSIGSKTFQNAIVNCINRAIG